MRKVTLLVLCTTMMVFAWKATAQEASMEGVDEAEVDWEEAVYFAELVETYENDDGEVMNVFWDEEQRVMWDQPVDMTAEEALAEFNGTSLSGSRLETRIVPQSLTFCLNDSCTSYDVYSFLLYTGTSGTKSYWTVMGAKYYLNNVDRIKSTGRSYLYDYRSNWYGQYYDPNGSGGYWGADSQTTGNLWSYYYYHIDESSHLDNESYPAYGDQFARFAYKRGSTWYYSYVKYGVVE
jgi:hypothetical protein